MSARLLVLAKFLQLFAHDAWIFVKIPCRVAIYILETKTDTGNNVSRRANWETLEKRARTMNIFLPCINQKL